MSRLVRKLPFTVEVEGLADHAIVRAALRTGLPHRRIETEEVRPARCFQLGVKAVERFEELVNAARTKVRVNTSRLLLFGTLEDFVGSSILRGCHLRCHKCNREHSRRTNRPLHTTQDKGAGISSLRRCSHGRSHFRMAARQLRTV